MRVLPTGVARGIKRSAREALPHRLAKARRAAKLSASALSINAGLARGTVGLMETAVQVPRVGSIVRLAKVLGTSPGWLAFGDRNAAGVPDTSGLAERAQSARAALGITLHELGKLSGSSYGQAQSLETGADPTIEMIERFAVALQVRESWLAFGIGDRELPRRGSKPAAAQPTLSPHTR